MRISELARETAVPVATVKYYLREGLLHDGELTSCGGQLPSYGRVGGSHATGSGSWSGMWCTEIRLRKTQ